MGVRKIQKYFLHNSCYQIPIFRFQLLQKSNATNSIKSIKIRLFGIPLKLLYYGVRHPKPGRSSCCSLFRFVLEKNRFTPPLIISSFLSTSLNRLIPEVFLGDWWFWRSLLESQVESTYQLHTRFIIKCYPVIGPKSN